MFFAYLSVGNLERKRELQGVVSMTAEEMIIAVIKLQLCFFSRIYEL